MFSQDEELARQLVELGYRGSGEVIKREEFERRKQIAEDIRSGKTKEKKGLANGRFDTSESPFLSALATREEANRNGKMMSIVFVRGSNAHGQEVSGYIDFAQRLKDEDCDV